MDKQDKVKPAQAGEEKYRTGAPTTPGEAEGSLTTVEGDLREKEGAQLDQQLKIDSEEDREDYSQEYRNRPTAPPTPGEAEGSEDVVDADLLIQEERGQTSG